MGSLTSAEGFQELRTVRPRGLFDQYVPMPLEDYSELAARPFIHTLAASSLRTSSMMASMLSGAAIPQRRKAARLKPRQGSLRTIMEDQLRDGLRFVSLLGGVQYDPRRRHTSCAQAQPRFGDDEPKNYG